MLNDKVAEFYKLSAKIGGEVDEQVNVLCVCMCLALYFCHKSRQGGT